MIFDCGLKAQNLGPIVEPGADFGMGIPGRGADYQRL